MQGEGSSAWEIKPTVMQATDGNPNLLHSLFITETFRKLLKQLDKSGKSASPSLLYGISPCKYKTTDGQMLCRPFAIWQGFECCQVCGRQAGHTKCRGDICPVAIACSGAQSHAHAHAVSFACFVATDVFAVTVIVQPAVLCSLQTSKNCSEGTAFAALHGISNSTTVHPASAHPSCSAKHDAILQGCITTSTCVLYR